MINLKTTALAVITFSTGAVFAGSMGPVCAPGNVTVPCAATAWDVGVQALYLKPTYSNVGSLAGSNSTSLTDALNSETFLNNSVESKPNWTWAFKLEASYHLNTGNDINLNWYHLVDRKTSFDSATLTSDLFNPIKNDTSTLQSTTKPSWDAINLEFGQHVNFGERKKIRFHGGVQFARIKNTLTTTATDQNETDNIPLTIENTLSSTTTHLKYNGFGPRIGTDMSYALINGISMYANGATAILTGSSTLQNNITSSIITTITGVPSASVPSSGSFHFSKTVLVPELEAKLGLKYTTALSRGDLTIDAGYMWVNYFNAQQSSLQGFNASNSSALLITSSQLGAILPDNNFGVQGPYLGLKWLG